MRGCEIRIEAAVVVEWPDVRVVDTRHIREETRAMEPDDWSGS
jgi:hypothetical protein